MKEEAVELIHIGVPQPKPAVSIREMFEQMAQREAEMVRSARERMRGQGHPAGDGSNRDN